MKKRLDKPNYRIHKKCHDCVIKFEHKLKIHGKYKDYIKNLQNRNKLTNLDEIEAYLLDAINNTSNSSFISEQGDIEDWRGGKNKKRKCKSIKKSNKRNKEYY